MRIDNENNKRHFSKNYKDSQCVYSLTCDTWGQKGQLSTRKPWNSSSYHVRITWRVFKNPDAQVVPQTKDIGISGGGTQVSIF